MQFDGWMGIVVVMVVLALGAVLAYFAWMEQKKRREALAALASELGWRFDPGRDTRHDEEYAHFEIFRRGHSRAAFNTLWGDMEIEGRTYPAKMGDFTYKVTTSNGKSSSTTTYTFSYLIVHLPYRGVPDLLIRREGMFDKIAGAFGFGDINFESAEFSRKFFVRCRDKRFAYDVVHPRMMEFLLGGASPTVDIERGRCCISDGTRRWQAEEFRGRMRWLGQFFAHWPEYLTRELDARAGAGGRA